MQKPTQDQPTQDHSLLKRIEEQEAAARKFGFYWEHISQLIKQIQSECLEVQEAWENNDRTHLEEEIGDLIQATVSLAIFCDLDPHETLLKATNKFQKRYDKVVELAESEGHSSLHKQPFEVLMNFWDRAKKSQK
jgi:uncharacterized protein YabN with tetrapyrrole methylase and pyrophosphatase domain